MVGLSPPPINDCLSHLADDACQPHNYDTAHGTRQVYWYVAGAVSRQFGSIWTGHKEVASTTAEVHTWWAVTVAWMETYSTAASLHSLRQRAFVVNGEWRAVAARNCLLWTPYTETLPPLYGIRIKDFVNVIIHDFSVIRNFFVNGSITDSTNNNSRYHK